VGKLADSVRDTGGRDDDDDDGGEDDVDEEVAKAGEGETRVGTRRGNQEQLTRTRD
jgi:hypothetical protein